MKLDRLRRESAAAAALLGIAIAALIALRIGSRLFVGDDAYMTFRVSKNFLVGNGFVCNPGERVLSTSTPLWAWLVAVWSRLCGAEPAFAFRSLSTAFDISNLLLLFWLGSFRLERPILGGLVSVLFALSWHANYSSMIGMETPLFVFLLLSAASLSGCEQRPLRVVAACIAGLSFTARPEGALVCAAFLFVRWRNLRKVPWLEGAVLGAVVGLYLAWMGWYFGSIMPQAAIAKALGYHRKPGQALSSLASHLRIVLFTPWFDSLSAPVRYTTTAGALGLWVAGAGRSPLLFVFNLLFLVLYACTNPLVFEWYVVPLEASYLIGIVWGAAALIRRIPATADFQAFLAVLCAGFALLVAVGRYDRHPFRLSFEDSSGGYGNWPAMVHDVTNGWHLRALGPYHRENLYIEAARYYSAEIKPGQSVLAPEFGAFGYYSPARMISSIGHVNPEVFKYLPVPREELGPYINNGISMAMVDGLKPDYILSLETFIRFGLLRHPEFFEKYDQIFFADSPVFGSKGLYLFRRKAGQGG